MVAAGSSYADIALPAYAPGAPLHLPRPRLPQLPRRPASHPLPRWRRRALRRARDHTHRDALTQAVTLDAALGTQNAHSTNTCILSTANPVASGATILLVAGRFSSASTSTLSVSGGGLTWTEDKTNTSGNIRVSVFRANAPSGLAAGTSITVTNSAGSTDMLVGAGSFNGIATSSPVRASAGGSGSSSSAATGTVASQAGDFLFAGYFEDGNGSLSYTTTATELFDFNNATQTEAEGGAYKLSASANDSITFSLSASVGWVCSGVAYIPAAGGGTTVTATRALSYDIANTVTAQRGLSYDIRNTVTAQRGLSYDIANNVVATRALNYDLSAFVAALRALSYDILNTVAATRGLSYDVLSSSQVAATRGLSYDVLNSVVTSRALSYDLLNSVVASRGLSYDIINAITAQRGLSYDIVNSIVATRALSYDLLNAITAQRVLNYDVLNSVSAQRTLNYDLGNVVVAPGVTRQGLWYW